MTDFSTPLEPGTRVRNRGEQYPRAYEHGTATILERTHTHRDGTHEIPGTPRRRHRSVMELRLSGYPMWLTADKPLERL